MPRFHDLIDIPQLQDLTDSFLEATDIPIGILDPHGTVLVSTGWQEICSRFHRAHPVTEARCRQRDACLMSPPDTEKYFVCRCANGLVDAGIPIVIAGERLATLFVGQFLFEKPDESFFRKQAEEVGFDIPAYLESLSKVPIFSERKLDRIMTFYGRFVKMLTEIGLARLELLETNRKLQESEEQFRTLVDHLPIGLSVNDTVDGRLLYMNPQFEKFYGWPREVIVDVETFFDRVYPDPELRERIRKQVLEDISSGDIRRMRWEEFLVTHSSGEERYVSAQNIPVPSANLMMSTVWDVTDHKHAAVELRRYELLAKHSRDIVLFMRRDDGRILEANEAASVAYGYSREELLTLTIHDLRAPANSAGISVQMSEADRRGNLFETIHQRKDGSTFPVEVSSQGATIESIRTLISVVRDVTERKRIEEHLRHSQQLELVGSLAGGIAHEFNNLMTVVTGYASLVLDRLPENAPHRGEILQIRQSGEQAATLTRQLLAFGRKQMLSPRLLDLNESVVHMGQMLHRLIGNSIRLTMQTFHSLWKVTADLGQIEQVIMNLAVNARDAMPDGGSLTIETSNEFLDERFTERHPEVSPGEYVLLTVSDTGTGMDQTTQSRIFEPFFTTKDVGKGTGLGLSTVYGILRQSGGHIFVDSELGKGSSFRIYLPRALGTGITTGKEILRETAPGGCETILVVEDEEAVLDLVRNILEAKGYRVVTASNGEKALALCVNLEAPFHLLLTDITMPGVSGPELAVRIGKLYPGMKTLFISAFSQEMSVLKGVLQSGVAFLQKPFSPEDIARKVRSILDEEKKPG